ncbi:hypothetical protein [Segniliparus rugosus]|uniref:Uncharacterized protein n=1 Tax=Segniliparus rugosus (strain ATCC BAA-974 / DSM 45345 / CCUG 50838 / CIP 108380 / JCM 13579 / CDC 945) TaxID=679197 RepID=U1LM97_SEGRC|nr:hypothetical protein [Segniliparus rugosus]ERG69096.1 hypothetical protein HMPREF9336_04240 [Segniliparus rugosus ATCC BAA-974]
MTKARLDLAHYVVSFGHGCRRAAQSFFGFATWGPSRKRLRQRLLVWPAPILALLLLLSLKMWSVVHYGDKGVQDFTSRKDPELQEDVSRLETVNIVNSWRAHFFRASQLLAAPGDPQLERADHELVVALAGAPQDESCGIRTDLVGVRELRGDQQVAQGHFQLGKQLYQQALDYAANAPDGCFQNAKTPNTPLRDWLQQTKDRLDTKTKIVQHGKLYWRDPKFTYPVGAGPGGVEFVGDDKLTEACANAATDVEEGQCIKEGRNLPPPPPDDQPPPPDDQPPPPDDQSSSDGSPPPPSDGSPPPGGQPPPPGGPGDNDGQGQADPDLAGDGEILLGDGSPLDRLGQMLQWERVRQHDRDRPKQ